MHAGARRGLALKTRQTYAGWATRFAAFAGTPKQAMDEGVAREWLTQLVTKDKVAYSTQKQALNALVFFFRDVCNHTEIDLQVRLRKTQRRQPTILNRDELMRLIGTLEPRYRLPAMLQYGSGLRLSELVSLRIKDVDVPRGVLTVHSGKGDKDRITMMPNCLKLALDAQIAAAREWWQLDRDQGHPGVFLPTALARKMPKAGIRWEWFWLFPDDHLSKDPESEIIRRHHLHASS